MCIFALENSRQVEYSNKEETNSNNLLFLPFISTLLSSSFNNEVVKSIDLIVSFSIIVYLALKFSFCILRQHLGRFCKITFRLITAVLYLVHSAEKVKQCLQERRYTKRIFKYFTLAKRITNTTNKIFYRIKGLKLMLIILFDILFDFARKSLGMVHKTLV